MSVSVELQALIGNARLARRKALNFASDLVDDEAPERRAAAPLAQAIADGIVETVEIAEMYASYLSENDARWLQHVAATRSVLRGIDARISRKPLPDFLLPLVSWRAVADEALTAAKEAAPTPSILPDKARRRVFLYLPVPLHLLGADGSLGVVLRDVCGEEVALDLGESDHDRLVFRPSRG